VRTLLSTRLFAAHRLDEHALNLARRAGFPALELFADPGHLNLFDRDEVDSVVGLLAARGMRAPGLFVSLATLSRLGERQDRSAFARALRQLHVEAVVLPKRPWASAESLSFPHTSDVVFSIQEAGAMPVLNFCRAQERILRHLRRDVGLCWDLAWTGPGGPEEIAEIDTILGYLVKGRLRAVRVAHVEDGMRVVPGLREELLLRQAWKLHAPATMVYDVEDPSRFGSMAELTTILEDLRAFHTGRMHAEAGGGVFWAALAPG
jgi:sugar phosphate isomerase/epimerase